MRQETDCSDYDCRTGSKNRTGRRYAVNEADRRPSVRQGTDESDRRPSVRHGTDEADRRPSVRHGTDGSARCPSARYGIDGTAICRIGGNVINETDYSVYKLNAGEWVRYGLIGAAGAAVAAYVFYRSWTALIVMAVPAAVLYPIYKRRDLLYKRQRRLASEFREGITVLSSSLSAGFSMENAMAESEGELRLLLGEDALIVQEFSIINSRIRMNMPVEACWQEFADRSGTDDIRNFVQVIKVAKRSGGELNAIIAHSADTIGDKIQIKEEIVTMTAAKSFEQKIMSAVPAAVVLYIDLTSPGFFDWMYSCTAGRLIMTACLITYIAAVILSAHILRIEV